MLSTIISTTLKSFTILIILASLYFGYEYGKSKLRPMLKYHTVHDRPSLLHSIFEGFDVWNRNGKAIDNWGEVARINKKFLHKKVILTGGTKGLGRGMAAQLVAMGVKQLILPCRRCDASIIKQQVLDDAKKLLTNKNNGGGVFDVEIIIPNQFDLVDLSTVEGTVNELKNLGIYNIDILINNAGVASNSAAPTKQGFEPSFSINFLGPIYFTKLLTSEGLLHYQARIVMVGSEGHREGLSVKELMTNTGKPFGAAYGKGLLDAMPRYDTAKFAVTTYSMAMGRLQMLGSSRSIVDVCPGPVASDIAISNVEVWPINVISDFFMRLTFISTTRAALPVLRLASVEDTPDVNGKHFHIYEERPVRDDAADVEIQDNVVKWTDKLLMEKKAPQ
jgi:NAD(P)-dependent dehydrogenase (short-subunit alcohol dehydrogenase family)